MSTINVAGFSGTIGSLTVNGSLTNSAVPIRYSHCSISEQTTLVSGAQIQLKFTQLGGKGNLLATSTTFGPTTSSQYYKVNVFLLVNVLTDPNSSYLRFNFTDGTGNDGIRLYQNYIPAGKFAYLFGSGVIRGGGTSGYLQANLLDANAITGNIVEGSIMIEEYTYGST